MNASSQNQNQTTQHKMDNEGTQDGSNWKTITTFERDGKEVATKRTYPDRIEIEGDREFVEYCEQHSTPAMPEKSPNAVPRRQAKF